MDSKILSIYKKLPEIRKNVLNRLLMGYSTKQIADDLFKENGDSEGNVRFHYRCLYEDYKAHITNEGTKITQIIILFHLYENDLISEIYSTIGSPLKFKPPICELPDESIFKLQKVTKQEVKKLHGFGRKFFDEKDHFPLSVYQYWHDTDKNSFRKMTNKNGELMGYFVILFIDKISFNQFAEGYLTEKDLKPKKIKGKNFKTSPIISSNDKISTDEEIIPEEKCYLSVVVGKSGNKKAGACILLCLIKYLDKIRTYKSREFQKIYGLAATEHGRNLMKIANFYMYKNSKESTDNEDFFELNFDNFIDKYTSFLDYCINIKPILIRCKSFVDFTNEDDWIPDYSSKTKDESLDRTSQY